jgi:putative component of toxin-antitoxin plasmid stabilization module
MKDVTQWFPGDVKPVHVGVYERDYGYGLRFWYFDGSFWRFGGTTTVQACRAGHRIATEQSYPWRGLADKP